MTVISCLLGAVVLLFGRRLFWAFVVVTGFLAGIELAEILLVAHAAWLQLVAGAVLGLVGALVAVVVQRVGFAIAGFYAGGYLSLIVANALVPHSNLVLWFVCGGALGAIVAAMIMDRAIVVLSSVVGAAAIVASLSLSALVSALTFIGLTIAGIAVQTRALHKRTAATDGVSEGFRHAA